MTTLTDKEQTLFNAHREIAREGNNCTTIKGLLADNFSCATVNDFKRLTGFSKHTVAGLISSMTEKGVMYIEPRMKEEKLPDLYWIDSSYLEELLEEEQDSTFFSL